MNSDIQSRYENALDALCPQNNDKAEAPDAVKSIVSALGAIGGVDECSVVLAITAVMNGWAPMTAGPRDGYGVGISRELNLLLDPGTCMGIDDFHTALLKPVWRREAVLHKRARAADAKKVAGCLEDLGRYEKLFRPDSEHRLSGHVDCLPQRYVYAYGYELLRRPVFYMRDPDDRTLERGLTESLTRAVLVDLFGSSMFEELASKAGRTAVSKAEAIVRLLHGGHRCGPGLKHEHSEVKVERCRGALVGTTDNDSLASILTRRCEPGFSLLKYCIVHPATARRHAIKSAAIDDALERWDRAVADRITADVIGFGNGDTLLETVAWPRFVSYRRDLQGLADHAPAGEVAFLRPLWALPARILCGLRNLSRQETVEDFKATAHYAEYVARRVAAAHVRTYAAAHGATIAMLRDDDNPEARMLEKLRRRGPMQFRDLLRMYSRQVKRIHQPVLDRLMESGRVFLNDEGLLEADAETEEARKAG